MNPRDRIAERTAAVVGTDHLGHSLEYALRTNAQAGHSHTYGEWTAITGKLTVDAGASEYNDGEVVVISGVATIASSEQELNVHDRLREAGTTQEFEILGKHNSLGKFTYELQGVESLTAGPDRRRRP